MSSNSNILKRKNDDLESSAGDQLNKRVALDSEQLDLNVIQQEQSQTAPAIGSSVTGEVVEPVEVSAEAIHEASAEKTETVANLEDEDQNVEDDYDPSIDINVSTVSYTHLDVYKRQGLHMRLAPFLSLWIPVFECN